jgi:hypothetical protein
VSYSEITPVIRRPTPNADIAQWPARGRQAVRFSKPNKLKRKEPIMATATVTEIDKALEHMGETKAMANHDHDLVHELSKRLDAVWRYDQFIANADGKDDCQQLWRTMKKQDMEHIAQLRKLIKSEIKADCF